VVGLAIDYKSYKRLRLGEFNSYDTERTLRENIYELEQENFRIEVLANEMVEQKIPVPIILDWLRQLEDNAAEIVYVNSVVQHDLRSFNFAASSVYRKESQR
jgi:hypothetical protein